MKSSSKAIFETRSYEGILNKNEWNYDGESEIIRKKIFIAPRKSFTSQLWSKAVRVNFLFLHEDDQCTPLSSSPMSEGIASLIIPFASLLFALEPDEGCPTIPPVHHYSEDVHDINNSPGYVTAECGYKAVQLLRSRR